MERKQYYNFIHTYNQRRIKLKKKFSETGNKKYQRSYQGLTRKICYWKSAIRRIDKRNKKVWLLISCVNKYFGVKIESRIFNSEHKLARAIYYKIGMENRLRGRWLSKALGRKGRAAESGRLNLTRSFKTNEESRQVFYQFKKYLETSTEMDYFKNE